MIASILKKYISLVIGKIKKVLNSWLKQRRLNKYLKGNRIPWTKGYDDFKWNKISEAIYDKATLNLFQSSKVLPQNYGIGLDERIVEYPFVFSRLKNEKTRLLDAGSTFNFEIIISHPLIQIKETNIFTYYPENWSFVKRRISYQFGDLRDLPYRHDWFDEIACISTLEHVGMDNRLYGYEEENLVKSGINSDGYLEVIKELMRVLKPGGQLLITFPFGKKKSYGFFQQFDSEMLKNIRRITNLYGKEENTFFKYTPAGWIISDEQSCSECESFNPHTGEGKGSDGAAHSRAIFAMQLIKNK